MTETSVLDKEYYEIQELDLNDSSVHNCWKTYGDNFRTPTKTLEELIAILDKLKRQSNENTMCGLRYRIVKIETKTIVLKTTVDYEIKENNLCLEEQ